MISRTTGSENVKTTASRRRKKDLSSMTVRFSDSRVTDGRATAGRVTTAVLIGLLRFLTPPPRALLALTPPPRALLALTPPPRALLALTPPPRPVSLRETAPAGLPRLRPGYDRSSRGRCLPATAG